MDAIFAGGITGLIGTGLTYIIDFFKAKQATKEKLEVLAAQERLQALENQKIEKLAMSQLQSVVLAGETKNYDTSMLQDKAAYSDNYKDAPLLVKYALGFVDFLRGIIRPGTTIGYSILFGYLLFLALKLLGPQAISLAKAADLIDAAIYLTSSTTLWWFGVRPIAKGGK